MGGRVSGGECEDIWEGLEGEMHDHGESSAKFVH